MNNSRKLVILVAVVLLLDQVLKIWVKTNMGYGEEIYLFGLNWARIHFVENPGMAFGLRFGEGDIGKLALSIFRIIAISCLVYLIGQFIKNEVRFSVLASFGLILAGAIGNTIDSAFYGLIFSESYHDIVARIFPPEGGYAGFLHGKVVDMFYFPMFQGYWPDWMPYFGGRFYLFFKPVFNIADMSISVGVLSILLFQRSFFFSNPMAKDDPEQPLPEESVDEEAGPDELGSKEGPEASL